MCHKAWGSQKEVPEHYSKGLKAACIFTSFRYFKHKHTDLYSIFDKESGNIHRFNETSNRVNETSNQIKPCEFHIKHCSQSESTLSGFTVSFTVMLCKGRRVKTYGRELKTKNPQQK